MNVRHALLSALCISPFLAFLSASPALAGSYSCSNGARLIGGNRCSDGSIPVYQSQTIPAYQSRTVPFYRSTPVARQNGSGEIHVFTPAERAQMMENDRRAAHELAQRWTHNGRGLNGAQLNAIENQRCLMMAAGNPDVRCVPR